MKYKQIILASLIIAFICLIGFEYIQPIKATTSNPLTLKVNSAKQSYMLGEAVNLTFELINNSKEDVSLGCFGVGTGELQLFMSNGKKDYLEYNGGWGTVDAECHNLLKAGDKIEIPSVKVLWNYKINVNHLNEDAAKEHTRGKITNDYAFPEAGIYYIKAWAFNNGTSKLESEPIQITIEKPIGEDLEVWNKIKDNGDFAYFIQAGEINIPSYKTQEKTEFLKQVEQIIIDYPNSFYSEFLRQNLNKFKTAEAKRREFMQKVQKQP